MESRSWTELSSNVTQLEGVRLDNHLHDLLRQGGAPAELLQSCLHEFTHHSCFLSSVGLAVTSLVSRAARASLAEGEVPTWTVARDLVAYRTVTEALRPLTEGLALFAEFDVMSIDAKAISLPLQSTALLFSGRFATKYNFDGSDHLVAVPVGLDDMPAMSLPTVLKLQQVRLTDAGMRRKTNVLAASTDSGREPYLLGYLAVKGMWRSIRQRSQRLYRETDLAMMYIMSFFYEDRGLLEILLAPGPDENESTLATAILRRIADRMKALSDVTADDVAEFEQLTVDRVATGSPQYASCLRVALDEWTRGERPLEDLTGRILNAPDEPPQNATSDEILSHELDETFAMMLLRRHIVHLGAHPVYVDVDEKGAYTVTLNGRELVRGTGAWRRKAQSGQGLVELLFSVMSTGAYRAIAIYGPKSFVDVVFPGEQLMKQDELDLIRNNIRPSQLFVNLGRAALHVAETFLEDRSADFIVTRIEPHVRANVKRIYLDIATNAVADEDLERVIATLDAGGIYAILGKDRDLLDALIILSVLAPTMPFRSVLAGQLHTRGFTDPDAVIDALVRASHNSGLPLVGTDGVQLLVQT